ncbi:hypothetical protein GH714_034783 [Hevea brasiliensis]|uniref:Uncharacterized protein n=1 Tax=Hevea brasiliensis TaxID=3981 RepID=A0A6A6M709_HEVBR|nr:hypothetical protein GH714_034783 [Hevea brasiliensis]
MEHRRQAKDSLSYSNLFNLESLMNFKVPQPDDDFDYYGNSSQDESRGSQGGAMANYGNGTISERDLSLAKRKKRSNNSDREEGDGYYGTHITEERYRSMLGEHIQKYKRRFKDSSSPAPALTRMGIHVPRTSMGSSKTRKLGNELRGGLISYEPAYLDIGEGVTYRIPPSYDKLAASLNLPSFSDIRVEEFYLKGTLDLGSLAEMISHDKRFGPRSRAAMGEPQSQYESLQARLKAMAASNSAQKFSLKYLMLL